MPLSYVVIGKVQKQPKRYPREMSVQKLWISRVDVTDSPVELVIYDRFISRRQRSRIRLWKRHNIER